MSELHKLIASLKENESLRFERVPHGIRVRVFNFRTQCRIDYIVSDQCIEQAAFDQLTVVSSSCLERNRDVILSPIDMATEFN